MEIGKKIIETKNKQPINIYFLGDIHEGNCNCNHNALKKAVDIIKDDPFGYWIGMGDYIEAIIHFGDPRFDPKTISQDYAVKDLKDLPMKQMERVFNYLQPIQEKCLALLCGNHEESYIKRHSSNIYDRFVEMFKTSAYKEGEPPLKLGYVGFLDLTLKYMNTKVNVVISLNHGVGGGGFREGYPINKIHDVFKYTNGDINVMGHIHQLKENRKTVVTVKHGRLKRVNRLWGSSGTFLETYVEGNTNYWESRGGIGGDSDIGMLKCELMLVRDRSDNRDMISWDAKLKKVYL